MRRKIISYNWCYRSINAASENISNFYISQMTHGLGVLIIFVRVEVGAQLLQVSIVQCATGKINEMRATE